MLLICFYIIIYFTIGSLDSKYPLKTLSSEDMLIERVTGIMAKRSLNKRKNHYRTLDNSANTISR